MLRFCLEVQSKTANIWFSNEVDRRYGAQGLHSTSLHPGMHPQPVCLSSQACVPVLFFSLSGSWHCHCCPTRLAKC